MPTSWLLRGDQNLSNTIRLYARYNWFKTYTSALEAVPVTGVTQPRTNHNTLVTYTHTLSPTLFNDFRIGYHRIDFDTLNYFGANGIDGAGTALGIPGFDADTRYSNPGLPSINITNFAGLGGGGSTGSSSTRRSRCRTCSPGRAARTTSAPASTCAGSPPAGAPPTIRAGASTSPARSPATRSPTSCSACRAR